jgi:hypothetical protein
MQYLLMCCFDETAWEKLPEPERAGVMEDYGAWMRDVDASGRHRATAKLAPTAAATTIRERSGRTVITDGPFAETKEQLGGYHLVECKDLDEAIAIAKRIPTLRVGGSIEVRPLDPEYTK